MVLTDSDNNSLDNRRGTVRRMAGSLDNYSIDDTELDQILERADQWMIGMTKKTNWTDTDDKWALAISASNNRAAADCLDSIPTREAAETAKMKRGDARELIKLINEKEEISSKWNFVSAGPNIADNLDPYKYTHVESDGKHIGTI